MSLLEKAIAIAVEAHAGKKDKAGQACENFIERSASNPIALRVKLADLEYNMDVRRMHEISEKDRDRPNRYLAAYRRLLVP